MAAYYLLLGTKKLGLDFLFAQSTYFLILTVNHFVTLRSGAECVWFYTVATYNLLMYINIAFSNPGWLDEPHKKKINEFVSILMSNWIIVQENGRHPR